MLSRAALRFSVGFVGIVGLVGPATLGCKRIREKITEKAAEKAIEVASGNKVDIDQGGNTMTIKGDKPGEEVTFGASTTIPADFPKDVPIYPGAGVTASAKTNAGPKQAFTLSLETSDSPEQVLTFYKSKVPAGAKKFEMNSGEGGTVSYETPSSHVSVISGRDSSSGGSGKSTIVLTVSPK